MAKDVSNEDIMALLTQFAGSVDERFEGIDQRFENMDKRFESMDRHFDKLEFRMLRLEEGMADLGQRMKHLEESQQFLTDTVAGFVARIDAYETDQAVRDGQFQRLLEWAKKVSEKTGIPLEGF